MFDIMSITDALLIDIDEQLKKDLDKLDDADKKMYSSDILKVVCLTMANTKIPIEKRWKLINTRASLLIYGYLFDTKYYGSPF